MKFIIRRSTPGTVSGILPASALPIGTPLMYSDKDPDTGENTFAVATGKYLGFMSRASRVLPGLTDEEQLMGFGLETPFQASKPGTVEVNVDELEVEGDEYIVGSTATGAISSGTSAGTKLSFSGGKFYEAQSGDLASFELVHQMTPTDGGACRIYVRKIDGYLVP